MDTTVDMNDERFAQVYQKLEKFVWWLANQKKLTNVPLMDADEIAGDLFEEMFKGYKYYQNKIASFDEICAVIRKMLDNRVRELLYKYTCTHRGDGLYNKSLERDTFFVEEHSDITVKLDVTVSCTDADSYVLCEEDEITIREKLSETAAAVYEAVSGAYHPVIRNHILMASKRSKGNDAEVYVRPWHIGDALGLRDKDVRQALREIGVVCKEVRNGR